jgi:cation transport protein ChaC
MHAKTRILSLTAEHVARIHRSVEDAGYPAHVQPQTDADYREWVDHMIRTHPAPGQPTRLFAYGSLIWKPEIEHASEEIGVARGWHRSFCFRVPRFRGTPERPGLMMALDRGGQCRGLLFDLPHGDLESRFDRLFRREFTTPPVNSMPKWIKVGTADGEVAALAFVMNRASPQYAGRLSLNDVADVLSMACGHWGTGAEYLLNTVTHLEAKGIRDSNLWRLQRLVAERIDAAGAKD